jgi:hypothetical protein
MGDDIKLNINKLDIVKNYELIVILLKKKNPNFMNIVKCDLIKLITFGGT